MADEIIIETKSPEVVEVGTPGPQGIAGSVGPANTLSIGTVTTGVTASATITGTAPSQTLSLVLPKGDKGDPGDIAGEIAWSNITGKPPTFAPSAHALEHEPGEADAIQATAALVTTNVAALSGIYFSDDTSTNGKLNFFRTGTRKNTKLQYNSSTLRWELIRNLTVEAESIEDDYPAPWGQSWSDPRTPATVTSINVVRAPLETMVQKLAETGTTAVATTSEDGLLSASDKQKLNNLGTASTKDVAPSGNASATQVVLGNDTRLTDTRDPNAHTHTPEDLTISAAWKAALATSDDPGEYLNNQSFSASASYELRDFDNDSLSLKRYNNAWTVANPSGFRSAINAASDSDARLTDAREWSADTITQAEAEAGTATTRRAFTALRVFQSIAAWWNASSAKTKLDGIATNANNYTHPNHTGDVTSVGDGATTIANNAVTNAKLAQVATSTIKGRATAATGNVEDLTATQVRSIINVADGATANSSDATLLNRANHTGTQAHTTITGLATVATTGAYSDLSGRPTLGTAAAAATTDFSAASHNHAASAITSGTLDIARIPTGTTSTTVALGNHSHELTALAASGATNGHVLTANGSGGVTFAAASGGLTGIASSASQVLATSSGNITGVDGNTVDSADPFIKWNDTAARLEYANPLSRPAGAMYVGVAPTSTALGTRAINIQADRSLSASRIATGTDAVLVGNSGEATATQATALGHRARATGNYSFCAGTESTAQGPNSICLGYAHGASATDSVAIGSYDSFNFASFGASAQNTLGVHEVANLRGQVSFRPFRSVYWGGQTTDATANVTLNLDATGTNPMTIAANTAVIADISLIARRTDNTKFLAARRWVAIRRDGSNNTALIGAVQTIGTDQSEGSPTWTFTIDADDTASVESLRVRVTGASETVNWRVCAIYRVVA